MVEMTTEGIATELQEFSMKLAKFIAKDRAERGAPATFYMCALEMASAGLGQANFIECVLRDNATPIKTSPKADIISYIG
jgi:hypothetical protein